jgi:hypothetical protein
LTRVEQFRQQKFNALHDQIDVGFPRIGGGQHLSRQKLIDIRLGISSGEQLGAGVGEFDVGPGFVSPQPALRDCALDAGAVFGRTAAGGEKGAIDPLNIDAAVSWGLPVRIAIMPACTSP